MSAAVNARQKTNNAIQERVKVWIILRRENDHESKPDCHFAGHHVPADRSEPPPLPNSPYQWSYSNILEGHRNGRFAVGAAWRPSKVVRFQICKAYWPDTRPTRESTDIEPDQEDFGEECLKQLKLKFGEDNVVVKHEERIDEENEDVRGLDGTCIWPAWKADMEGGVKKKCIWFDIMQITVWR